MGYLTNFFRESSKNDDPKEHLQSADRPEIEFKVESDVIESVGFGKNLRFLLRQRKHSSISGRSAD